MNKKIDEILITWHKHFEVEDNQYSEFEPSDIEYFVGCMLYNHFSFSKALDTMKTIDLSYDFLETCGDEYDDIKAKIESIELADDVEKLKFLQEFLVESKAKYSQDELYLLDRLDNHVAGVADRTANNIVVEKVEFKKPEVPTRSPNPLLR
ncbi:MAG: hypothetical protein U9P72_00665 [Campylobacterota bacterium]|nr:hypothetical protein [Campylobacterota bacterium]